MKMAALPSVVAGTALTVAAFVVGGAPAASADAGAHVATGSDATPDKCASCHRTRRNPRCAPRRTTSNRGRFPASRCRAGA